MQARGEVHRVVNVCLTMQIPPAGSVLRFLISHAKLFDRVPTIAGWLTGEVNGEKETLPRAVPWIGCWPPTSVDTILPSSSESPVSDCVTFGRKFRARAGSRNRPRLASRKGARAGITIRKIAKLRLAHKFSLATTVTVVNDVTRRGRSLTRRLSRLARLRRALPLASVADTSAALRNDMRETARSISLAPTELRLWPT